jgi:hypothetical protein
MMALPPFLLKILSGKLIGESVKSIAELFVEIIGYKKEIDDLKSENKKLAAENSFLKKQRIILILLLLIFAVLAAILMFLVTANA